MGNVNISIDLVGQHGNNGHADDAERLAAEFVVRLRERGHTVLRARMTHGGAEELTEAAVYLQELDERRADKERGGH